MKLLIALLVAATATAATADEMLPVRDSMQGKIDDAWRWVREVPESWRVTPDGLEIQVLPGNMWGPANDAKNVLVRPAPAVTAENPLQVTVTVENRPTAQYEQVDLAWYYADSHMVKLGQELVDGQLSIVMGREENDRARTIAIIPLSTHRVTLRLRVHPDRIEGYFRPEGADMWQKAGQCDLPRKDEAPAQVSIQVYQGPDDQVRWARIRDFEMRPLPAQSDN